MMSKVIKNNYRIMDEIGQGSVATVYLAKDTARNQVVALKLIHPEQAAEGQFLQRFQREVKLLRMLSSPQAVKVLDYGEDEGLNFIVLEYVQGETLASILEEERPLEVNRALDIAKQAALCLVDAHAKSIVHRDIRPANIMVTAEGTVKVMDFGIAWGAELSRLTATGVLGSPHYLSPEQAEGKEIDSRSDIYSLGVTLFEMLSGRKPYDADSAVDIVLAHLHEPIPSLHQLDESIPLEVDELVRKCLAKKPADRYQSAAEFLEAIDQTLRTIAKRKEGITTGMEASLGGRTLGAYRIIEQIGRGGMATVYKAYEPALDRYVAIKVLPQYFAHDPDFAARFEREAKAVAKLNHPNILPIYSFGQEAGLTYIAMRYVEAGTLKEMLGQPLDLKITADILGQIGRALDYAHQRGVVHRDVKPTNVLMAEGKWALLTDFGLARMVESSVQLTKTGVGVGTPAYMSPEQGQGIRVDARSDVYSLGVVLYEMVTGKVPYEAETPMAVVLKHITAPLPLPRAMNPDLPEAVERVILKAMAKAPQDRYQTVGEMVEALERAVAGAPVVERPPEVKPVLVEEAPSAVVAEPAPAPVVTVPLEAPPVAKKGLPGWVWGVVGAVGALVLLIVAGGVFLATRGEKPSPTPGAPAALVATPTASPASPRPISPGDQPMDVREVRPCDWEGLGPGLCIYPLQGGRPVQILKDAGLEFSGGPPSWSPDGRQIAFSAHRLESPGYDNSIYIVNADGTGLTELLSPGNYDADPAWSPDGEWLVFHRNGDIAIMHPDGSDPALIWSSRGRQCSIHPQWSPDSQWIVVSMKMGDCEWIFPMRREVWVISRDGATVTAVATTTHKDEGCARPEVAFSPDGTQVAYVDGNCRSWVVNVDGSGQATPLDDFPFWWISMAHPQWEGEELALPPKPMPPTQSEGKFIEPCEGVTPPQICVREAGTDRVTRVTSSLEFGAIGSFAWSPDGQQIIFNAGSDPEITQRYDHKLYVLNADGSDLRPVTSGDVNDADPAWSPDRQWIVFHRNCGLWVIRPDGSDGRMLLEGSDEFCAIAMAWSPDSQQIAFWNEAVPSEIWVINRDGADPRAVYSFKQRPEWVDVAWNPDGRQIACWYSEGGKEKGFLISADGSGEPKMIHEMPWSWLPNFWPQWSGGELAPPPKPMPPAQPEEGKFIELCEGVTPPQICVRDARTDLVTQVTSNLEFGQVHRASWSPDGQQIVFDAGSDSEVTQRHDHKLYLINADGSDLRQITSGDTNDITPAWSPDGQRIVFHRNCGLWVIRPDGSEARMLLEGTTEFCASAMVWSPDSQQVAFLNMPGETALREAWVINRDGTDPHMVHSFERPLEPWEVAWSPDGRQIVCWYGDGDKEQGLLINADGGGEPKMIHEMPWSWLPNFWPQWGGEK